MASVMRAGTASVDQIQERREALKQQRSDIDLTLKELDEIELQCQGRLASIA